MARSLKSYRGARRNAKREPRANLLLKAERKKLGMTRSTYDRMREPDRRLFAEMRKA